ncbi:hypothetical protein HBI17_042200 [Parastagonospora nodorum]|nr:hypothetical protein HBH51_082630 [Parastagonospora nodorum]KAH4039139.1 hypothetical protein HBI09_044440 [Parastagonospora nodorum]KAH4989949.1 hypothetical protein HBI76_066930 [Parastagonospora nodorum]KAH5020358.1 hypothetical protein HBI77_038560 [Parastagonospora nodorum]KAH5764127.1 hypothetical protein HBI17_042200 [Parastagonospora nodorum]
MCSCGGGQARRRMSWRVFANRVGAYRTSTVFLRPKGVVNALGMPDNDARGPQSRCPWLWGCGGRRSPARAIMGANGDTEIGS